jgi:uncharacterized protein (TIGR00269 family)
MNKKARESGFTKLATGHNLDDEAETILMNFFSGNINLILRSGPRTGVIEDSKFIPRIKPLYFCTEKETTEYSKLMRFPVLYEKCPCSVDAHRRRFKNMLDEFERVNPGTKRRIVENFLKILPELREFYDTGGMVNHCEECGEPSSNRICNACRLIEKLIKRTKHEKDE